MRRRHERQKKSYKVHNAVVNEKQTKKGRVSLAEAGSNPGRNIVSTAGSRPKSGKSTKYCIKMQTLRAKFNGATER